MIYMTGDKSEQAKSDAETVGAFGILHKPVNIEELNDLIKSGLSSKAA